jgi:hypothetical protein
MNHNLKTRRACTPSASRHQYSLLADIVSRRFEFPAGRKKEPGRHNFQRIVVFLRKLCGFNLKMLFLLFACNVRIFNLHVIFFECISGSCRNATNDISHPSNPHRKS